MPKTLPSRPSITTVVPDPSPTANLSDEQLAQIPVDPSALFHSVEDAVDSAGIYLEELRHITPHNNDTPYWRGYAHAVEVYRGLLQDLVAKSPQITLRDTIEVRDLLTAYLADNVYLDAENAVECYEHGMHDSLIVCGKRLEETIESIAEAA